MYKNVLKKSKVHNTGIMRRTYHRRATLKDKPLPKMFSQTKANFAAVTEKKEQKQLCAQCTMAISTFGRSLTSCCIW